MISDPLTRRVRQGGLRLLNFVETCIHSPDQAAHKAARYARSLVGVKPRCFLQSLFSLAVDQERPYKASSQIEVPPAASTDLLWEDFDRTVLSRRNEYKGVFIQEPIIDWSLPLYQRPQHIAVALGRLGYLVIYKTPASVADDVDGYRLVAPNVWITNRNDVDLLTGAVRSIYSTSTLNTPASLGSRPRNGVMVYEYMDHIDPKISGNEDCIPQLLAQKKWAFEGSVDFVVASARVLEKEAKDALGQDKVIFVPNGVDAEHYRLSRGRNVILPEEYVSFRNRHSNLVGYFGAIAPWLWHEMLGELVEARPDVGFVFIGPDYNGGSVRLPRAANILRLGTVPYNLLPSYARPFDVCLIPFEPGDIAKTTSPLKLFEYFALEKPVVVTSDMSECLAYPAVFSANSSSEFSKAIDDAYNVKDDVSLMADVRACADRSSWLYRASAMEPVFLALKKHSSQVVSARSNHA